MRIVHTHTYTHTLTHVGSHCISVIYAPWPGSLMLHQMTRSNDWPSLSKRMLPYFFLSKRCSQRCHYGVLVLWLLYSSFGVSLLRQKKKKKLRRVSSSTFGVKLSLQPSNFRIIFFHHRHIQYKLQQQDDISQLSCFFFFLIKPCRVCCMCPWSDIPRYVATRTCFVKRGRTKWASRRTKPEFSTFASKAETRFARSDCTA